MADEAPTLSRDERNRRCSVDCADSVCWRHWQVGGEYPKKLVIKNTHEKLQVIEYKLPQRKATFFVDFPAPVTLSSGMAYELEIKFRPAELVDFHDFIEISVRGRGSFRIALDALTPFARLTVPEKHDFEFCPVSGTISKDFTIVNSGTIPLDFYWEVPEPFDLQPRVGALAEGESLSVRATFHPTEATSVVCRAVCKRSDNHDLLAIIKFSGVGKYAFVSFADAAQKEAIEFGQVLSKTSSQRVVVLQNRSAVDAQFAIHRVDHDIVCPFVVVPTKGVIPRDGVVKLTVKYSPAGSGAHAANDFVLQTVGGNQVTLRCRGSSTGPTAHLSATRIDYGDVNLDELQDPHANPTTVAALRQKLDRFVTLKNTTEAPIRFQFVGTSPGAAFVVTPFSGQVAAHGTANIRFTFSPKAPLNYLRRMFLLVNDTEQALYIDVLGTAYNVKARPAPFTIAEAKAFFARMETGLGRCTPEDLAKLSDAVRSGMPAASEDDAAAQEAMSYVMQVRQAEAQSKAADPSAEGSGKSKKSPPPPQLRAGGRGPANARNDSTTRKQRKRRGVENLTHALPNEDAVTTAPFALDRQVLAFRGFATEGEVVVVRNNTGAKATATWAVPENTPWSIVPEAQDVPPFSTAAFRVRLAGNAPTASFGNFLECFVNFKEMRSFRLVSDDTFCPPHCLLLQCQRLMSLSDTASAPQVDVPPQLAFPPCHEKESVLQVVSVANKSDTVAAFHVQIEARALNKKGFLPPPREGNEDPEAEEAAQRQLLSSVFTCFPSTGVVPPNETILLLLKFTPPDTSRYVGVAKLVVNDSPQGSRQIALRGEGFLPTLELDGGDVISFRPTSVGGSTTRTYSLRNPSRIPVRYEVVLSGASRDAFDISPTSGIIAGCGKHDLVCTFRPTASRRIEAKAIFTASAVEDTPTGVDGCERDTQREGTQVICQLSGEGLIGVVSMEPLELTYGSVLVGESKSQQLTIYNSSLCDLQYQVRWTASSSSTPVTTTTTTAAHGGGGGGRGNLVETSEPADPEFINGKGVIRARSHVNVHVSLQPHRGSFEYILYVLVGGSEDIYAAPNPEREDILRLPHCVATVTGAFPLLQVTDVRSVYQPKSHLWRQLSLSELNSALASDITPADIDLEGYSFDQASRGLSPVRCDLGVDVFRAQPISILCRVSNVGSCTAKFRVWLPNETEIPKEPWHQTKLCDDDTAAVVDANLFDVFPRQGSVAPGGSLLITLTYRHAAVGAHTLPILVLLEQGKKLLLELKAMTLHETAAHLHFHHSLAHTLSPVAVGDLEPPLQYTELQNLSHRAVQYTLDESCLNELREQNYDFPIFQCLNPVGSIPPMSTMLLSWYFRPLEAKSYDVVVRVSIDSGETYEMKLVGTGYHPKKIRPAEIKKLHQQDFLDLPRFPTLRHPGLPCWLSLDVLRFGAVPFHSLHRQMVTVKNDHPRDAFVFEWHSVLQYGDQILDIDPPRGRLAPGDSVACRVTLYSGSTSHIIDNPVHCHVLNEDLRARRLQRRAELQKEAALDLDDEKAGTAQHAALDASGELAAASGSTAAGTGGAARGHHSQRPRVRQPITTIPPKFQNSTRLKAAIQSLAEAAVSEEADENSEDFVYVDVLPSILELLVQARIMPVESFHEVYGEVAAKSVFFPTLATFSTTLPPNTIDLQNSSNAEWVLVHDILEDVVKQIVHHPRIEDAFRDASEDPVPYFCEISDYVLDTTSGAMETRRVSDVLRDEPNGLAAMVAGGQQDEAATTSSDDADQLHVIDGDLQCLVEEVLEGQIYQIMVDAMSPSGVVTSVANQRLRGAQPLVRRNSDKKKVSVGPPRFQK